MKYVIIPNQSEGDASSPDNWSTSSKASLDGCFYDHISADTGPVIGVRYWANEHVVFDRHPVFKQFLGDRRFKFCQEHHFVDIVFSAADADSLQRGALCVITVQDLGGDFVLEKGDLFGISFSI